MVLLLSHPGRRREMLLGPGRHIGKKREAGGGWRRGCMGPSPSHCTDILNLCSFPSRLRPLLKIGDSSFFPLRKDYSLLFFLSILLARIRNDFLTSAIGKRIPQNLQIPSTDCPQQINVGAN